jgi:CheY-like chemotaxis protein
MAIILIVDDSAFQRKRIKGILIPEGHELLEATDGSEALKVLETNQPDVILLDLLMDGMDGVEFLQVRRKTDQSTPIIVLTADVQETVQQECFALGATEFVNKPPKPDKLLPAIERCLSSSKRAMD